MSEKQFIVHATDRGYWGADRRGYYLNPTLAGVYSEKEALGICGDKSRKEKMYTLNGKWHKAKIKDYRKQKCRQIQVVMEGMTSLDVIEIIPDLIKERMVRNG